MDSRNFLYTDKVPDDSMDVVLLQSSHHFNLLHEGAEGRSYLYKIGHNALNIAVRSTMELKFQRDAIDLGAGIFEALSVIADPDETFRDKNSVLAAQTASRNMAALRQDVKAANTFLLEAKAAMEDESPHLTCIISEIAGIHTRHRTPELECALMGAASMRSLQLQAIGYREELAQTHAEA